MNAKGGNLFLVRVIFEPINGKAFAFPIARCPDHPIAERSVFLRVLGGSRLSMSAFKVDPIPSAIYSLGLLMRERTHS
jgi:hypothetical protein